MRGAPPKILCYVRTPGSDEEDLRARMHRADGSEDAGTGSANCALVGLLARLAAEEGGASAGATTVTTRILQGVEMGRPSRLLGEAHARRGPAGVVVGPIRIGGHCAAVSRGELCISFE